MKLLKLAVTLALLATAGCAGMPVAPSAIPPTTTSGTGPRLDPDTAARQFAQVVSTLEPVIEQECRRTRRDGLCDYDIVIDTRLREPANAFQTVDETGQPVLIFTISLIADMRNPDELALVMSHEASHHILDHLSKQQSNAQEGARIYAKAATLSGASQADIARASELGAVYGAATYSKQFELEADDLGARIAKRAGFDPVHGALYFLRLPDPGDDAMSSHPSNSERSATIRRAAQGR